MSAPALVRLILGLGSLAFLAGVGALIVRAREPGARSWGRSLIAAAGLAGFAAGACLGALIAVGRPIGATATAATALGAISAAASAAIELQTLWMFRRATGVTKETGIDTQTNGEDRPT